VKLELPNFNNFEIEDCELVSLQFENENKDILMKFTCPVIGWRWKRHFFKGLRAVFFPKSEYLAYEVEIRFLNVSELNGSYVDSVDKTISANLFEHGFLIMSDMRFFQITLDCARLYIEFDEGSIGFEFNDCIQREAPIDSLVN